VGVQRGVEADAAHMKRALELAEAGWGRVHPNPLVGAVVVRDGVVVGEGAHREYGGPHAEVEALRQAGRSSRGATLYTTLEPCAHHGKTPPCTEAILEAGVARVVFAVADPNPAAAGGAARLRERGVTVVGGVEAEAARGQNLLFLVPAERDRPFLALKLALSLDGRIAAAEGERTRITGAAAEAEVHRLRAGFDAVLVGGRTARVDDPLLTARGPLAPRVPPLRVVASATGDLPVDGRLVKGAGEIPVRLVAGPDAPEPRLAALRERGVEVRRVAADPSSPGGLDPRALIHSLWADGARTILCEGGGRLGMALLRANLVDRLYLLVAPILIGDGGVPGFPGASPALLGRCVEGRRVGADGLVIVDRSE
jgi:diaminohydroxyphosphoribosylaminopyrimidine deaminase / 5-amino-6-(5-phosphoribosylamino)uracil reductase